MIQSNADISFLDQTAVFHKMTEKSFAPTSDQNITKQLKEEYPAFNTEYQQENNHIYYTSNEATQITNEGDADIEFKQTAQFFFPGFQNQDEKQNQPMDKNCNNSHRLTQMSTEITRNGSLNTSSSKKRVVKVSKPGTSSTLQNGVSTIKSNENFRHQKSRSSPRLTIQDEKVKDKSKIVSQEQTDDSPNQGAASNKNNQILPINNLEQMPTCHFNASSRNRFSNNRASLPAGSILKELSRNPQDLNNINSNNNTRLNNFVVSMRSSIEQSMKAGTTLQTAQQKVLQQHRLLQDKQKTVLKIPKDLIDQNKLFKIKDESSDSRVPIINSNMTKQFNLKLPDEKLSDTFKLQNINQFSHLNKVTCFRPLLLSPSSNRNDGIDSQQNGQQDEQGTVPTRKGMNPYIDQVQKNQLDDNLLESLKRQQILIQQIRQAQIKNYEGLHPPFYDQFSQKQQQLTQLQTQQIQSQIQQFSFTKQYEQLQNNYSRRSSKALLTSQTQSSLFTQQNEMLTKKDNFLTLESLNPEDLIYHTKKSLNGLHVNGSDSTSSISKKRILSTFNYDPPQTSKKTLINEDNHQHAMFDDKDPFKQSSRRQFYSFHNNQQSSIQNFKNNPHEELAIELEKARKQIKQTINKGNSYKVLQQFPSFNTNGLVFGQSKASSSKSSSNLLKKNIPMLSPTNIDPRFGLYEETLNSNREARTADTVQSHMTKMSEGKMKTFLQRKPQENILNKIFQNQMENGEIRC